jgi:hypothetical protein
MRDPDRGERLYRGATRGFSLAFIGIGIIVLVTTLSNGGGPASLGFLLGLAFIAVGGLRFWLGLRSGS